MRDDVRAKLRSWIKRPLMKYKYPPDKQPEAIKLVVDQMEPMAPRYVDDRQARSAPAAYLHNSPKLSHTVVVDKRVWIKACWLITSTYTEGNRTVRNADGFASVALVSNKGDKCGRL